MEFAGFFNRDTVELKDVNMKNVTSKIVRQRKFDDYPQMMLTLEKMSNGLYKYYAEQLETDDEHVKGYHWSSRVSCINYWFTEEMIDVIVNCGRFCIPILELRNILPKEYVIVKDKTNNEPTFKVIERTKLEIDKDYEVKL